MKHGIGASRNISWRGMLCSKNMHDDVSMGPKGLSQVFSRSDTYGGLDHVAADVCPTTHQDAGQRMAVSGSRLRVRFTPLRVFNASAGQDAARPAGAARGRIGGRLAGGEFFKNASWVRGARALMEELRGCCFPS
jgi:hypothetical protein